jgi:predicted phosphodiesterase
MRVLITADLHYNHPKSRGLAEDVIGRMNAAGGDVILVIGDTAVADGDALEKCLSLFALPNAVKLFVAGNHELWTHSDDGYKLYAEHLPKRVKELGWRWLETEPFVTGTSAIVGSLGWYDYSFAQADLGIPRRFYEHKVSPGAASRFEELNHLFADRTDIPPAAMEFFARWNDGRMIKLHRTDEQFLDELLTRLRGQLDSLRHIPDVLVATHHLPLRQLHPPPHSAQWDFAKAYLGSEQIGELLLHYPNVRRVFCGHSHFPIEAQIDHIHAINVGSGYRWKTFHALDLPD